MFFISFTYFALFEQQYQDSAPTFGVGIVTARGWSNFLDHCLLVILFFGGKGGGFCILKSGWGRESDHSWSSIL